VVFFAFFLDLVLRPPKNPTTCFKSLENDKVLKKCFVKQETETFPVIPEKMKKFAVVVSKAEFIYGKDNNMPLATATIQNRCFESVV